MSDEFRDTMEHSVGVAMDARECMPEYLFEHAIHAMLTQIV